MTITPGLRLGPYEVVASIGAGGMGHVYKARDTRLDRTVAIKVLSTDVASDPQFRERFEREAKILSSLDHQHICALYDVGREHDVDFLVMQHLVGETLGERLQRGPMPVDQALASAVEICDALAAAHRMGVVHRDFKPGNVMLTAGGAKLLDFGLAKTAALTPFAAASMLPTQSQDLRLTARGSILGTVQYMAPEQLEGKEADARTDIFAFGAVLYEMLTGRKAFEGTSQASVIAAIMSAHPAPITTLQPMTPPAIEHIVRWCLAKDPDKRFQSAHDLLIHLKWITETRVQADASAPAPVHGPSRARLVTLGGLVAASIVASAVTWTLVRSPSAGPLTVGRATITPPPQTAFSTSGPWTATNVSVSASGTRVAYVGVSGGVTRLYMRPVDRLASVPITGTEGALNPFFSPNGEWVGFFLSGKLRKVRVDGGVPEAVCDASFGFGAVWTDDDSIVFAGSLGGGLSRVSAAGGRPQPFTTLAKGEGAHRWPSFVHGGRDVVFAVGSDISSWDGARIAVQSLDSNEHRVILENGTAPQYTPSGQLIFARAGSLFAVPVDRNRWLPMGPPVEVVEGVLMDGLGGRAHYAVSTNGTLVYLPGGKENVRRALAWVDRGGKAQTLEVPARGFERPRISPDGHQAALTIREADADVWVLSLEPGTLTRLTQEVGEDESPVWSTDGKRVTYSSTRGSSRFTFWRAADGSGFDEQLFAVDGHQHLVGWMPDGRTLLTDENEPGDLFERSLNERTASRVYLHTSFYKRGARLSPDGRLLAYAADESGHNEVFVQSSSGRLQVSLGGGTEPVWARSGRELFYRNGDKMMVVDIQATPAVRASLPGVLFDGQYARLPWGEANYDVDYDATRFLMIKGDAEQRLTELRLVMNWFGELRRIGAAQSRD